MLGLRHHFWRMDNCAENTLAIHERLDFKYDVSMAFNDVIGFRRGCAFPYFPYYIKKQRPLMVLEMPTTIMDGAVLFEHRFKDLKQAVSSVLKHIEEIKINGGLSILDWHSYMWRDWWYPLWFKVYRHFLPIICSDKECYVGPLIDIANHFLQREQIFKQMELKH